MKKNLFFNILAGLYLTPMLAYTQASLVKDINPNGSSNPSSITNVNSTLFFVIDDNIHGRELWKSDGTEAGTIMVKDFRSGSRSSNPRSLTNVNDTLIFTATDDILGEELWKSDGTDTGTVPLTNSEFLFIRNVANVDGTLFFSAFDVVNGEELWKSDGTDAGTVLVKDINPGLGSSSPASLTNVNGTLFFSADDGIHGFELWKSDGTEAGTEIVTTRAGLDNLRPSQLTDVNSTLFFSTNDGINGFELWKSDGTEAGTILVKDINPKGTSSPSNFIVVNGTLFFLANFPRELWKSDGTKAGTVPVDIVNTKVSFAITSGLFAVDSILYLTAPSDGKGIELWRTDETAGGTFLIADINPGSGSSSPASLTNVNGTLFFSADDGTHGFELWKFDGDMQKQYVLCFTLVDADTDTDITVLSEGGQLDINELPNAKLNIRANTIPPTVGSIFLRLNGPLNKSRTENAVPYALFGDHGGDYKGKKLGLGEYNITATPYTKPNRQGEEGSGLALNFSITEQVVTSFTLVNADTDTDIMKLTDGMQLNINELPQANINVRANTAPPVVGSVFLSLSGPLNESRTENKVPYALFGDHRGDYRGQNPRVGSYTISATPYTKADRKGGQGKGLTLNVSIVDDQTSNMRTASKERPKWNYSMEKEKALQLSHEILVYPNPFIQTFTVGAADFKGETVEVHLYDLYGKSRLVKSVAITSGVAEIEVAQVNLSAGTYLLKVIWEDRVEMRKIIKNDE